MCGGSYQQPQATVNTPSTPVSEITAGQPKITPAAPVQASPSAPGAAATPLPMSDTRM